MESVGVIYRRRTDDRADFVRRILEIFRPALEKAKRILVKPNAVSAEPYPTTTSPELLAAVLGGLRDLGKEVVIADEPAVDARRKSVFSGPLDAVCRNYGGKLEALSSAGTRRLRAPRPGARPLRLYRLALDCDCRISLPILKVHGLRSVGFTGALKNQFSFLSRAGKIACHIGWRNIHRAIVDVNLIAGPQLVILDAIETLLGANERRHGGRPGKLGTLLAGSDPAALDRLGFSMLAETGEPKLSGKSAVDIGYLRLAAAEGLGSDSFRVVDL
ncbi:MAG: DUF362 domain-containing protein [Candidatus Aminicenantes bacterium]|nr:DUF362 domain-containing protein [Candidatus Aminicenantes bacterium]